MSHRKSKQSGSVLVVAIFVIVVMGFLASSLTRVNWSNSDNQTREHLGTQAWLLAHSANEWALTQLYPIPLPLPSVSDAVSSACSGLSAPSAVSDGMATICVVEEIACTFEGELDSVKFYKLKSVTECGSGKLKVQRSQEVWVKE